MSTTTPHGQDEPSSIRIFYYILIAAAFAICLGFGYSSWNNGTAYPVGFAVSIVAFVTLIFTGSEMVMKADSGKGHFGGPKIIFGIILYYGAASIGNCLLPGKIQNDLRKFASPFQADLEESPNLTVVAEPEPKPEIEWVEATFNGSSTDAVAQIHMRVVDKKVLFPVQKSIPKGAGNIIVWGKSEGTKTKARGL